MGIWALVPLKLLEQAKQRLARVLTPQERRGLCLAMAEDLLVCLSGRTDLAGILLVSDDPEARILSRRYDAALLTETALGVVGLNPVVRAACSVLARRESARSVMTIHADLPLVTNEELSQLLTCHSQLRQPAMTIATDRHGRGSNCLIASLTDGLRFHYGPDSLNLHSIEARRAGYEVRVFSLSGIACDVDTPMDLQELMHHVNLQRASATCRYLHDAGIIRRLLSSVA